MMQKGRSNNVLYYGLLLYVLIEYVRPGQYIPIFYALKIGTLLPIFVFVLSIFTSKTISNKEIFSNRNSKWIAFFLSLLIISIFTADVTLYPFTKFRNVLGYILIYFVIAKELNTINRMKGFFVTLSLAHIIVVVLSPDVILHPETRPYLSQVPFLGDGNDFALSVAIVLPLCLFVILHEKSKTRKLILLSAFILLVLCIIGTSSRGGSLALSAVILYLWLKSKRKLRGVIAILILIWAVVLFAPSNYFQRMDQIANYENEGSAQGRIMAWKSGVRMALAHPLTGVGAGHFAVKLGTEFRPPEYGSLGGKWITAHSCYFLILGELGFPGIIFLVSIIISNLWSNEKKMKELKKYSINTTAEHQKIFICINASMIAFAVGGAFLSAVYYPHLYTIAGLFVSGDILYKKIITSELEQRNNINRQSDNNTLKKNLLLRKDF